MLHVWYEIQTALSAFFNQYHTKIPTLFKYPNMGKQQLRKVVRLPQLKCMLALIGEKSTNIDHKVHFIGQSRQ